MEAQTKANLSLGKLKDLDSVTNEAADRTGTGVGDGFLGVLGVS